MNIFNKLNFFSDLNFTYNNKSNIAIADHDLVRYFKVEEYGRKVESTLEQHLYQKKINNVKKAA